MINAVPVQKWFWCNFFQLTKSSNFSFHWGRKSCRSCLWTCWAFYDSQINNRITKHDIKEGLTRILQGFPAADPSFQSVATQKKYWFRRFRRHCIYFPSRNAWELLLLKNTNCIKQNYETYFKDLLVVALTTAMIKKILRKALRTLPYSILKQNNYQCLINISLKTPRDLKHNKFIMATKKVSPSNQKSIINYNVRSHGLPIQFLKERQDL